MQLTPNPKKKCRWDHPVSLEDWLSTQKIPCYQKSLDWIVSAFGIVFATQLGITIYDTSTHSSKVKPQGNDGV